MITLTTKQKFITFITIKKNRSMKSKSWSWHMWAAKTSSLPRPVERSSSERLPDNLQRLRIDISTNAWSHVDWPQKTEPVSLRIHLKRSQPQIWLFLHQWSIIFEYLICISHFSLLSSPLVILLPLPSAVELQDSSPLDLSFHRTCILEISILGTPTALRRTLSVHGAPVEGHQDRKDLFFIGCRKDKKL